MQLEFTFSKQVSQVSYEFVHKRFYETFKERHSDIDTTWIDSGPIVHKSAGGPYGALILSIRNKKTGKYIVISYWDRCFEIFSHDWVEWENPDNLVAIFSTAGLHHRGEGHIPRYDDAIIEPTSFVCNEIGFEELAKNVKPFNERKDNELFIRCLTYGMREALRQLKPEMVTIEKLEYPQYWQELNNSKIGFNLNGAGIICSRDMEVLSAGAVLFRPFDKNWIFHNPLIPDVHYVAFEQSNNPIEQLQIIENKFKEIRYNYEFLENVARNGHEWYLNNGTVEKNVEILHKLTNSYLKYLE